MAGGEARVADAEALENRDKCPDFRRIHGRSSVPITPALYAVGMMCHSTGVPPTTHTPVSGRSFGRR